MIPGLFPSLPQKELIHTHGFNGHPDAEKSRRSFWSALVQTLPGLETRGFDGFLAKPRFYWVSPPKRSSWDLLPRSLSCRFLPPLSANNVILTADTNVPSFLSSRSPRRPGSRPLGSGGPRFAQLNLRPPPCSVPMQGCCRPHVSLPLLLPSWGKERDS